MRFIRPPFQALSITPELVAALLFGLRLPLLLQKIEDLEDFARLHTIRSACAFVKPITLDHLRNQQTVMDLLAVVQVVNRCFLICLGTVMERRKLFSRTDSVHARHLEPFAVVEELLVAELS